MAHILEQDRTGLFTVVGAPPLAEEHHDPHNHYHLDSISGTAGGFIAGVWLTLYVAIVVVAIAGNKVGRAVDIVTAALGN